MNFDWLPFTPLWSPSPVLHSANREEHQTEAAVAKPLNASIPPTADGVDRIYHQLAKIHVITIAQLA
jgi:hypothetical protein